MGHPTEVWSLAAAFVSRINKSVFGLSDYKPEHEVFQNAWCLAKISCEFETDTDKMPSPPEGAKEYLVGMHNLGRALLTQPDTGYDNSPHIRARLFFEEVAPRLGLADEVIDLLRQMLVLDLKNQSTTTKLLQSNEMAALLARAGLSNRIDMSLAASLATASS